MNWSYLAYDARGSRILGTVAAESAEAAADLLRQKGLFIVSVAAQRGDAEDAPSRGRRRRGKAGSTRDVAVWAREMLILVRAGTPVAQALAAIESQQPDGPWRDVLSDIRGRVESGIGLGDAMGAHRQVFDPVIRSLITAGESSGRMDHVLAKVAEIARSSLKLRQTVVGALIYPCLLIVLGLAVSVTMLLVVVPKFSDMFESMGASLPPSTQIMVGLSLHLQSFWWAWLIILGLAAAGGVSLLKTPRGRDLLDGWLVSLPLVGRVTRALATARITRVLGVLLESHVPMLRAIELTREAAGNRRYAELMERVRSSADRGEPLSAVLARSHLISPSVSEAIWHGEASGQVAAILLDMTDFLDEENEVVVRSAVGMIEPMILAVLGLIVGGMAMSLFIPLFDVAASTGGSP